MVALFYSSRLSVVGLVSHSIAIFCTIFRLVYRGWTRHLWWEDAWAAFALISDGIFILLRCLDQQLDYIPLFSCLPSMYLGRQKDIFLDPHSNFHLCPVYRAARMSVIFSIIRITNHPSFKIHRQITYLIAVSFACMWAAVLAHRITLCALHACHMGKSVAISLLITDIVADISLVAAPLHLLRNVGLSRSRKILVLSAFSASLLITAITIPHSIILLEINNIDAITVILAHVKSALSLVICNLLVIVTFVYRVCWRKTFDLDQSCEVFTSVVLTQMPCTTNTGTLLTSEEGEMEAGAMKVKMEDASVVYVEEGAGTEDRGMARNL
ncbi:hypothetical protein EV702DRAFT_92221 [Suillus placidus]|uniref:Integral membrane protein n=1 Tax=Suillus placidus TaxID=48579 RepID=A0A9P7CV81_9AGAM|nr:hypothetical protein EV702DRAFT_92221 [Suillus placidus]